MTTARELRAQASAKVVEAGAILKKAQAANNRNLTSSEQATWERLHAEATQLRAEADGAESLGTVVGPMATAGMGGAGFRSAPAWTADSFWSPPGELRALRPDESAVDFYGARDDDQVKVGLGALARAAVVGPRDDAERRALGVNTDTAGGFMVGAGLFGSILDLLRSRNQVISAGAQVIPITAEDEARAVLASEPAAQHHAENEVISEGEITLGRYTFKPYTLTSPIVRASRELIEDARNLDAVLRNSFANMLAAGIDNQALVGQADGSTKGPGGLAVWPGITETAMASLPLDTASLITGRKSILEQDGPEPTAIICSVAQDTNFAELVDGEGNPLQWPPVLRNIRILPTTRLTDRAFLGDFRHLHILMRSSMQVEVLKERYMDQLQYGFIGWLRYDLVVERSQAFHNYTGVATS